MNEMCNQTKKVILLLVEGPTDEDALGLICSKLVKEHDIEFDVLHTDITADEGMTARYIEKKIKDELEKYLNRNSFIRKEDILKVVQIIDTDGAFIPPSLVVQSQRAKTTYWETHIEAKNRERLVRRNISKRGIAFHLARTIYVADIPYEIYYFSRNLEHVLHNISEDLSDDEKEELAFEIADRYSNNPGAFLGFLYNEDFHVAGDYHETWEFIMKNGNSLKRYSNMSVFFEKLGIEKRDDSL